MIGCIHFCVKHFVEKGERDRRGRSFMLQTLAGRRNKSLNNRKIIQKFSLKSHVKLRHERVFRRKFCLSFHSGAFVSLSQKFLFTFLASKFLKTIQKI